MINADISTRRVHLIFRVHDDAGFRRHESTI